MIEDYHYGELAEHQAAELSAHLRECAACRHELALLEAETRLFEAYAAKEENTLELDPDTWKRAAACAASRPGRDGVLKTHNGIGFAKFRFLASPWVAQAAAAVLLVALSVAGTLFVVGHRGNKGALSLQTTVSENRVGDGSLGSALQAIQRAEQEYIKAISELDAIVKKQESTLDPRVVAELQTNLRSIDERIAVARKAYYEHPSDAELASYMLAAYSRKVEYLQELTS